MTSEERERRLYHHLYETNEGIREQAERIVALEELVIDMWKHSMRKGSFAAAYAFSSEFNERMDALGVEVDG